MDPVKEAVKFLLSMFMNGPHKKIAQELLDAVNVAEKTGTAELETNHASVDPTGE